MPILSATRGSPASSEIRNNLALPLAGTAIREDLETILTNVDKNISDSLAQHSVVIHSDAPVTFTGTSITYTQPIEIRLIHNSTASIFTYTIPVGQTLTLSADSKIIYAKLARDGSGTGTSPSTNLTTTNGNLVVDASSIPALAKDNIWYLPLGIRIDSTSDQLFHWLGGNGSWTSGTQNFIGVAGSTYTASNINTEGQGIYDGTVAGDFQFKGIAAGSSKITVTDNATDNTIDIDVDVSELTGILESQLTLDYSTSSLNSAIGGHTGASTGVHGISGSVVGTSDLQTLTNKKLSDTTTFVVDASDPTIQIGFDAAGSTSTTTTITSSQTANRTITIPDETDTLSTQTNAKNQAIKYALVLG